MKRTAIVTLGLGLLLIAPALQAQAVPPQRTAPGAATTSGDNDDDEDVNAIHIEPAPAPAPPRAAAPRQPEDLTIEVTADPPPGPAPVYQRPSQGMYPPGYTPYDPYFAQPARPRRQRTPDSAAQVDRSWSRHVAIGGTIGFGSPLGILGVWVDINPSRHFGVTLGAGIGGSFGAALAFTVNVRPKIYGRWAPYIGAGFSANATPSNWYFAQGISVPAWSAWFNLEAGLEYRGQRGLFFRAGLGPTILMNTGYFTNLDSGGRYGPRSSNSIGYGPVAAADAHDLGTALVLFMLHVDVGGVLGL